MLNTPILHFPGPFFFSSLFSLCPNISLRPDYHFFSFSFFTLLDYLFGTPRNSVWPHLDILFPYFVPGPPFLPRGCVLHRGGRGGYVTAAVDSEIILVFFFFSFFFLFPLCIYILYCLYTPDVIVEQ